MDARNCIKSALRPSYNRESIGKGGMGESSGLESYRNKIKKRVIERNIMIDTEHSII